MTTNSADAVTTATLRTTLMVIAAQREAVIAEGPDAVSFLQGQMSQDLAALAPGESAPSLLLHPQGKISAWVRVARVGHERFVIDVDAGWASEVLTRLSRFKLRTKCDLVQAPWSSFTLVGPGADASDVVDTALVEHDMIDAWAGVPVRDVFGPGLNAAAFGAIPALDPAVFTALRIEAGRPAMGSELDESTIPAAAGIVEQSVSFTKGCYTGQELVARIDSRGNNVPRRLVGVALDSGDGAAAGAALVGSALMVAGESVGEVTSAGWSGPLARTVALAYVNRGVDLGARVEIATASGPCGGEIHGLPLIRA